MGIIGKIKKMGKTVINTTYEQSGAQDVKKAVQRFGGEAYHTAQNADKRVFGSRGVRHNVQDVRKLLGGKTPVPLKRREPEAQKTSIPTRRPDEYIGPLKSKRK